MGSLDLDTSVQYVRGVGPARAAEFASLGVHAVEDLIEYFPFRHECAPKSQPIGTLTLGQTATVIGTLRTVRLRGPIRRRVVTACVEDGTGRCRATWFHATYLIDRLQTGRVVRLTGTVDVYRDEACFANPVFAQVDDSEDPLANDADRFEPVYPASAKLPSKQIAKIIRTALFEVGDRIAETLPDTLRRRRNLPPRRVSILRYHHPTRPQDVSAARRRLAYEELLVMQIAVQLRRHETAATARAAPIRVSELADRRIRARLPFQLTPGQERAVSDIVRDMAGVRPMNRLLQADVGAGKTAVAVYAALAVIANRRQVVVLAPTEILAEQHYRKIERYLAGSRVRVALLLGGLTRRQREDVHRRAAAGEIDLLIGTHALLEERVRLASLGLAIIDEQHRFGVAQRARLRGKGDCPHYLVLTATPIPRTLAMTFFGDLDVSTIQDSPPGRGPVRTRLVRAHEMEAAWTFVRQRIGRGEQAFVVYPLVEESDALPLKAAGAQVERLRRGSLAGCRLELLHGKMKSSEKDAVMQRFRDGRIDVLVATTVVEVGIDVPNATVMVIEHADRYGLSQLHQLRGRIGRGVRESYCFLRSDSDNEKAAARLDILCRTRDGFRIAEEDLRLRGPGEVVGTRQHGVPTFKVANLVEDVDLLQAARDDAAAIIRRDARLSAPEHRNLRGVLVKRFADTMPLIDVG